MENKIEEAEVIEVKESRKPKLDEEVKLELKENSKIENNINKAKEYGLKLKEYALNIKKYYSNVSYVIEEKEQAETEKAEINKQKKMIEDFRKKIIEEFKKPINDFENSTKEAETLLKETYEFINDQVKVFDKAELEKIKEKVESYFNEYAISKDIDFIKLEDMKMSIAKGFVTATGNLTKKTIEQVNNFIDSIRKDLDLINTLEFKEEILIEYKKTLQCGSSIMLVNDRHKQLEEMNQKKEEKKGQELTNEKMLNKIDSILQAPKVEEKRYSMTFTVYGTKNQLSELTKYLEKEGLLNE